MVKKMKSLNTVRTNLNLLFRKRSLIPSVWIECISKLNHCLSLRLFDSEVWKKLFNQFGHWWPRKTPMINRLILRTSGSFMVIATECFQNPIHDRFIRSCDTQTAHIVRSLRMFFGMINSNIKTAFTVNKASKVNEIVFVVHDSMINHNGINCPA